jgi:hypothetical protein
MCFKGRVTVARREPASVGVVLRNTQSYKAFAKRTPDAGRSALRHGGESCLQALFVSAYHSCRRVCSVAILGYIPAIVGYIDIDPRRRPAARHLQSVM